MDVFTPEEDERLIHLVSQYPVLYDTKHVDFKEQHLKNNIWKDISKELNKTGYSCCKRHWRNIRDGYARYKKCKSAYSDAKNPRSKWQFYKLLSFLDGVYQERSGTSYTEELPRNNETESQDMYSVEAEFVNINSLQGNNAPANATENITTASPLNEREKRHQVKAETNNFDSLLDYFKKRDEMRHSLASLSQKNNTDANVETFSSHVKDILNKLPPILQIKAKKDIFDVLYKYEIMAVEQTRTPGDNVAIGSRNFNFMSD